MTKKIKLGMMVFATFIVGSSVYAAKGEAGSVNDPLVTKSYVDSQFSQLQKTVEVQASMIDLLTQEINHMGKGENSSYEVVTVPEGQSIVGKQGTEIIVRSGNGEVLASEGGGLQDMTEGTDLLAGSEVPKYHLVIIPREDGRGIYAKKDLIVMVRGGYNIQ